MYHLVSISHLASWEKQAFLKLMWCRTYLKMLLARVLRLSMLRRVLHLLDYAECSIGNSLKLICCDKRRVPKLVVSILTAKLPQPLSKFSMVFILTIELISTWIKTGNFRCVIKPYFNSFQPFNSICLFALKTSVYLIYVEGLFGLKTYC